jgi:hypothetical protein
MQFERAIRVLCENAVEFVVIGGVSAIFHGSARVTYDLDLCYSRNLANLRKLAAALAPFHPRPRGFPAGLPFVWDEVTLTLPALIHAKRAAGRDKDLAAIPELESLLDANTDQE